MKTKAKAKTSAPKTTKAKSVKTVKGARPLARAEGSQCFWVTDGQVLADLLELRDSLERMADDVFAYHVTKERNDFADWVDSILGDSELSVSLRRTKKPKAASVIVARRLKIYGL